MNEIDLLTLSSTSTSLGDGSCFSSSSLEKKRRKEKKREEEKESANNTAYSIIRSLSSLTENTDIYNKFIEVSQEKGGGIIESLIQSLHEKGPHSDIKNIQTCLSTESELLYQSTQIGTTSQNNSASNNSPLLDPENTPLHNAILKQSAFHSPTRKIIRLLNQNPEYAYLPNSTGELPLHYACFTNSSIDVIRLLIKIHPDAVRQCNSERMLPLHFACLVGAPCLQTVQLLLKNYPGGAVIQSELTVNFYTKNEESSQKSKRTSLDESPSFNQLGNGCCILENLYYNVMFCNSSKKTLEVLPEGKAEEVGWTPLHLAIVNEASVEVIDALLKAVEGKSYSTVVDLQTSQGRSALDFALLILDHLSKEQAAFTAAAESRHHENSQLRKNNYKNQAYDGGEQRIFMVRRRNIKKIVTLLKDHADQDYYGVADYDSENDLLW